MFDYKKFEDRLVLQMENTLAKLMNYPAAELRGI